MPKCVVIADDLTGANATCSLLKKLGLKTASLIQINEKVGNDIDVVAYSTNSRGLEKEEAYDLVKSAVLKLKDEETFVINKRIDSTMRGNIGREIDGILDGLDGEKIAIVVPVYPDSGRIVIKGIQLVNGVLLKNSDAGKDPKTPVVTSQVREIIQNQSKNKCAYIELEEVEKGEEYISELIKNYSKDHKIIIFDAITNEDIGMIAKASVSSEIDIITVDPGPFTMYYTKELLKNKNMSKKVLMAIGSVTLTTKNQIEELLKTEDVFLVKLNPELILKDETRDVEIKRAIDKIAEGIKYYEYILLTTTPLGEDKKLDLEKVSKETGLNSEEVSLLISNSIAKVSKEALIKCNVFEGIFSCGGDITIALLEHLNAVGVEIKEEVIPLAAYGRILGGLTPNLKLISKGGMVGNRETIKLCLNKIKNDI